MADRSESTGMATQASWRRAGLGRKLLVAFLLLSLIPLLGSNTIGYLRSRAIIEGLTERYLDGVAELQAARVVSEIEQHLLYLEAVASGNRFLLAAIESAGDGQGAPGLPAMNATAGRVEVERYLVRNLEELAEFQAIALFGSAGGLIAATGEVPILDGWRPSQSRAVDVIRSPSATDPPVLRLEIPVLDTGDQPVGRLVGVIPQEHARNFLHFPERIEGRIASFVLDALGRPLLASHAQGLVDYANPLATPLRSLPPGSRARYRNREGVEVIATSVAIPQYSWLFLTEVPVGDALSELEELGRLSTFLGVFFAVLVLVAAWVVAGGIVAPLRSLVAATREVGRGHLGVRVDIRSGDEIGELGRAFNEMTVELAESTARIEELHHREIERAEQLATVGELASGIAHEIKNPVIGISNGLDLVVRRLGTDERFAAIVTEMKRELARIEGAIRDLLTFARPRDPTLVAADLNEVVARAVLLVEPAAEKGGITVGKNLSLGLPALLLDVEMLRQALVNLLINAVHATQEGGEVVISSLCSGDRVVLEVRDTGRGISDEDRPHLFKPFFTTRHSGTGLGLPITRGIVARHGGWIEVESELGQGSSFKIVLPVTPAPSESVPEGDP